MKEAVGEANTGIVTIVLLAIVITGGTAIVANITRGMKKNDSMNCSKYGYSYDASSNKCVDVNGNKFNMPGIGNNDSAGDTDADSGKDSEKIKEVTDKGDFTIITPSDETPIIDSGENELTVVKDKAVER